jgi:hypothetical protein
MKPIIAPVDVSELKKELTPERLLRRTNRGDNEVYLIRADEAPNLMREIGRVREDAFRRGGTGTGLELDVTPFDKTCLQMLVWSPDSEEIAGGYRMIEGSRWPMSENGQPDLATSHLFHFSEEFLKEYKDCTVEVGRSYVTTGYQRNAPRGKSIYIMDNLWDGIGAYLVQHPEAKYLFGKVTIPVSFNCRAREMMLYFMKRYFPAKKPLITPYKPLEKQFPEEEFESLFKDKDFESGYRVLKHEMKELGERIPPMINSYMMLTPTMQYFGSTVDETFAGAIESAILITVDEMCEEKKARHMSV